MFNTKPSKKPTTKSTSSSKPTDKENTAPAYQNPPHFPPSKILLNASTAQLTKPTPPSDATPPSAPEKSEKEIQSEIQSIFRQITASVTFLPQLDAGNCTFNVLVYADADSEVPMEWGDSDAREIENGEKVQLRSFSTSSHRVDTLVSYRYAASSAF